MFAPYLPPRRAFSQESATIVAHFAAGRKAGNADRNWIENWPSRRGQRGIFGPGRAKSKYGQMNRGVNITPVLLESVGL